MNKAKNKYQHDMALSTANEIKFIVLDDIIKFIDYMYKVSDTDLHGQLMDKISNIRTYEIVEATIKYTCVRKEEMFEMFDKKRIQKLLMVNCKQIVIIPMRQSCD